MARGAEEGELLERARQLRARIASSDTYDLAGFKNLLEDLRGLPANTEVRGVYEELVAAFPTAVAIWSRFVEAEMAADATDGVKAVFGRCLMQCPSVDLWFMYLKFIKKSNEARGAEGVVETKQAYEFTLDTIGQDIHSGPLWQEYIAFLSGPKSGSPAYQALWSSGLIGGQEESAKTAALRKAYQRAITVPTHSLELIWKHYEAFENATAAAPPAGGGSSAAAKQFATRVLQEQRPRFNAARMAYRERKRKMEGVDTSALPVPPGKGGPGQAEQVKLWRAYLDYERSNPQRLEAGPLAQRVELAYMQSLMPLMHFPEVWYDYARWQADSGRGLPDATTCLQRAVHALPNCLLLFFALADMHEAQGDAAAAKEVYESLVRQLEPTAEALQQQQQQQAAAAADPVAAAAAAAAPLEPAGGPIASLPSDQAALVWIQYMRFCRRSESVTASRKMFLRAKKAPKCPWQVYVASAMMEWRHARGQDVARKIFEKGLEVAECATTPAFVAAYASFLCDTGDIDNARVLYERVLTEDANRRSASLWESYLAFEYEMGDLQSALRLEKRAREALGEAYASASSGPPSSASGGTVAAGGGGGGSSVRNMQLLLLRYQFGDSCPAPPAQAAYLQYLLGKGPPPPGYEKGARLGGKSGSAAGGGSDSDGPRKPSWRDEPPDVPPRGGGPPPSSRDHHGGPPSHRGGGYGGPPPHYHGHPAHWHESEPLPPRGILSPLLDRFFASLPPAHCLDGPLPDLNQVVGALLEADIFVPDWELPPGCSDGGAAGGAAVGGGGGGGIKREYDAGPGGDDELLGGGGPGRDVYRMRAKQKARLGGD